MMDRSAQLLGQETRKAKSVSGTLRRLWAYFRKYYLLLALIIALIIAATYAQVLIPNLTGQTVDCYITPYLAQSALGEATGPGAAGFAAAAGAAESAAAGNCWYTTPNRGASAAETIAGLGRLVLLITALYIGSAIISGLAFFLMARSGYQVLRDLQADVFNHAHRLSLGYFSKHEVGDIMSRFSSDIDTLQQVISFGLISVLQGVLLIVWTIVVMMRDNAPFALISLITIPFMFLATSWFSNQARKAFRKARKEIGNVNADLQESITSVREVQAFSREEENISQFRESNAANRDANIRAQAFTSALGPTLEALSYVSLAVVAGVGGLLMLNNQNLGGAAISVGLIITFIGYTQQLNRPVTQIAQLWANIQSAVAGAERIFGLLDESIDIIDTPDATSLPEIRGEVRFKDVWAEYNPGEPVLRGINIAAAPGETIAIVGPTGAGKTTIINLLPRFWDVSSGSVTIDGVDIRSVTQQSLRSQIGIVLQDTFLFSDTVMNNIRYGRTDATDEEVVAAAKLARADEFITRLSDGYQTVLGERGAGLSQGQRQLLAIARVALTDPRILILDEATSSVDTRTEREIQVALEQLLRGRTSFVIAHRLSTIRHADQLLVLKDGQIIERGTHQELLRSRGFYHDLYMSQFSRRTAGANAADMNDEELEAMEEGMMMLGD